MPLHISSLHWLSSWTLMVLRILSFPTTDPLQPGQTMASAAFNLKTSLCMDLCQWWWPPRSHVAPFGSEAAWLQHLALILLTPLFLPGVEPPCAIRDHLGPDGWSRARWARSWGEGQGWQGCPCWNSRAGCLELGSPVPREAGCAGSSLPTLAGAGGSPASTPPSDGS